MLVHPPAKRSGIVRLQAEELIEIERPDGGKIQPFVAMEANELVVHTGHGVSDCQPEDRFRPCADTSSNLGGDRVLGRLASVEHEQRAVSEGGTLPAMIDGWFAR